jgi:predicted transcriptional regulator
MKVVHPQEIEVWCVLPVIRKELAIAMKGEGLDQNTIAKLLGVTSAAISQYVTGKRGCDFEVKKKLKYKFLESAKLIAKDKGLIFAEVQRLLNLLWNDGVVCELHKQKSWCPDNCEVCFENGRKKNLLG